jgi:pimeloyl-ACP methyl ester carboxylesterase
LAHGADARSAVTLGRPSLSGILAAVNYIEEWWSSGEPVALQLGGTDRTIFVRRMGSGPTMTMLHGYPSSSHDWARVAPTLAQRHALLLPDFLGFGASDKPADHSYSLHEQADLVEALWALEGITSTVIVAHDYAVSVTQELLARRAEGALSVDLAGVHLLNGGLYPDLARPGRGQLALLDPERGPQISAGITEERFVMALKPTFAANFDAAADSADIWRATARDGGQAISHRLTYYITDRAVHGERWITALEGTDVPVAFVWGMLDPVSGAHMAERIRERLPGARFLALEDVGHWPALEAPERVGAALLGA